MMYKQVNGVKVALTAEEESEIKEQWEMEDKKKSRESYKRLRSIAYEELGDPFEQIDFACKHGINALAIKRQDIKLKFPKPE